MARKARLHDSAGLYHVILRGNARQDVFFTVGDRQYSYVSSIMFAEPAD